jgi:hypothetical protein
MGGTISRQTALKRIVSKGIEPVLVGAAFQAAGKRIWVRRQPELLHLVALGFRYGTYAIEWFVVSPEATDFVWGHPAKEADPGDAIMFGTPSSIRRPAPGENFELGEQEDPAHIDELMRLVAQEMDVVATWLGQFETRRQLRDYLLENREPTDRRGFREPTSLPLKLYIGAVLAVLDRDPEAVALADEAEPALQPWARARLTQSRIQSLRSAVAAMQEGLGS